MCSFLFPIFLTFTAALGEAIEPNGAVPGLLSPVTELQFASRMEGKTIFQLMEDVVSQGEASLKSKKPIPHGVAQGLSVVGGEPSKFETWKISGIEREIQPIRVHIHRLHEALKTSSELNEKQKTALDAWVKKFDAADATCIKNPTFANIDVLTELLLVDVQSVFESSDKAEVVLLEAVMEATTIDQRLWHMENFFGRILNAFKKRIPIEDVPLIMDGVGIHPSVIIVGLKDQKAVTGFEKKYGAWIKRVNDRLKSVAKDGSLLKDHKADLTKLIAKLDAYDKIVSNGELETIGKGIELMRTVQNFMYQDEKLAPVALRIEVGLYASHQANFFGRLQLAIQQDLKNEKDKFEYKIGGIGVRGIFNEKNRLEVTHLSGIEKINEQLDSLIRLSEQTLAASKLKESDRGILTNAIQSLQDTKDIVGKNTPYAKWVELTNTINEIHSLYKF